MEPRNYDENPIRSSVVYDYETSKAFRKFHNRNAWKKAVLELGIAIIGFVLVPYTDFFGEGFPSIFAVLFSVFALLGALTLLAGTGMLFTKRRYEKRAGRSDAGGPPGNALAFYQHDFTVTSDQEGYHSDTRIRYDRLEKVGETKACFYLYTGPIQAIGVDKSLLENGRTVELRELLQAAVPPKRYEISNQ